MTLQAPFVWFGGKRRVAHIVWDRFGDVPNYVEPFAGSLAVLLGRPHPPRIETVNDKDAYLCNFWRAVQADPDKVAHYADWPVNESDLHARHVWLVNQDIVPRLEGDPDWYDAKIAGWWVWGMACWIGGEFCGGNGPWCSVDGVLTHRSDIEGVGAVGVSRRRPHLGNVVGVQRPRPHLSPDGMGVHNPAMAITAWMQALSDRLRRVRVCCGDWTRILGPSPTTQLGTTAVFLDPPYADTAGRTDNIYAQDCQQIAHAVREWAIAHGDDPQLRIALCGYAGEHEMPDSWECVAWKGAGGYGRVNGKSMDNRHKERIWFSPHCLGNPTPTLFDLETA